MATAPLLVRMVALSGAASAGLPSGTAASRSNTAGITVTGISMMTVPETVGVSTRWNSESRADRTSGTKDETTDQSREQGRTAGRDGGDADREEGPRGSHHDQMTRADPPGTDRLQNRGHPRRSRPWRIPPTTDTPRSHPPPASRSSGPG